MFVKNRTIMRLLFLLACSLHVAGCSDGKKGTEKNVVRISSLGSGYASDAERWRGFLSCWLNSSEKNGREGLILRSGLMDSDKVSSAEVASAIAERERNLGVRLPQSYKDFLSVYKPDVISYAPMSKGFLSASMINRAHVLDADFVSINEEYSSESSDEEYYRYGVGQDEVSGRSKNIRNSIVVGKYSEDSFALIVLYPQEVTSDGEMEAAIFFHSGQFRAPSFAELMRQIYFMENGGQIDVPPYEQTVLSESCARHLVMKDVWWK